MLNVDRIHTYYGLSHILFDVSLTVSQGEIVGLLGRNGAGKSTTMRSIMGLTPPRQGTITFQGEPITGKKAYLLVRQGIAYVPDDRRVFADLTVDDNLEITFRRNKDWNKKRVYRSLSGPCRDPIPQGRKPERRRAADAHDRQGPDEQARSFSCWMSPPRVSLP